MWKILAFVRIFTSSNLKKKMVAKKRCRKALGINFKILHFPFRLPWKESSSIF